MNTSKRLTDEETRQIAGMIRRGDRIQDVAYFFGVSPATVHRIKTKGGWPYHGELPPPGPYLLVAKEGYAKVQARAAQVDEAQAKLAAADELIKSLEQLLEQHRSRRDELATCSIPRTSGANASMVNLC